MTRRRIMPTNARRHASPTTKKKRQVIAPRSSSGSGSWSSRPDPSAPKTKVGQALSPTIPTLPKQAWLTPMRVRQIVVVASYLAGGYLNTLQRLLLDRDGIPDNAVDIIRGQFVSREYTVMVEKIRVATGIEFSLSGIRSVFSGGLRGGANGIIYAAQALKLALMSESAGDVTGAIADIGSFFGFDWSLNPLNGVSRIITFSIVINVLGALTTIMPFAQIIVTLAIIGFVIGGVFF